jgi:phospholipid transport system substrate-binding protein
MFGGTVCAQVDDQSDPQALIKTATQSVLDEVRTRASSLAISPASWTS